MSKNNPFSEIIFNASKTYVHHWPLDSPDWDKSIKNKVNLFLNKNPEKKKIIIKREQIKINDFNFGNIKKIGVTVPLFKKETTLVFEGRFDDFFAHVHLTTKDRNYLEIFNKIMAWKNNVFPKSD